MYMCRWPTSTQSCDSILAVQLLEYVSISSTIGMFTQQGTMTMRAGSTYMYMHCDWHSLKLATIAC